MGQSKTVWVFGALSTNQVAKSDVKIANFAQAVPFKVKGEIVGEMVSVWFGLHSGRLDVISRINHLIDAQVLDHVFVPAHKVDVTVEITPRHFVARRSFSLGREDTHVVQMS